MRLTRINFLKLLGMVAVSPLIPTTWLLPVVEKKPNTSGSGAILLTSSYYAALYPNQSYSFPCISRYGLPPH